MIKDTEYIENRTQEERILDLLKMRGEKGVMVYELMSPKSRGGLGIAQYNARIWGLRRKGYVIENTEPGHFVLTFSSKTRPVKQLTIKEEVKKAEKEDKPMGPVKYRYVFNNETNSCRREIVS